MIVSLYELPSTTLSISLTLYNFYITYSSYLVVPATLYFDVLSYLDILVSINLDYKTILPFLTFNTYLYKSVSVSYIFLYNVFNNIGLLLLIFSSFTLSTLKINISRIEKELNSFEDNLIFFVLLIVCILYIFGYYLYFYNNFYTTFLIFIYIILLISILIVIIPCNLLFSYGFYLPYYLRGASNIPFFFYEIFLDYINIISFFLRIAVQFIRIFLILLTIYTYNELYVEINLILLNSTLNINASSNWLSIIILYINWFLELVHIIIIFFTQLATFLLMLIWLFQFLFTMFTYIIFEQFYVNKRNL